MKTVSLHEAEINFEQYVAEAKKGQIIHIDDGDRSCIIVMQATQEDNRHSKKGSSPPPHRDDR